MKIDKFKVRHLRNATYFQFHTEFKDLIAKQGADILKIKKQFDAYLPLYKNVDDGLKRINKSSITEQIQEADKARDDIWSGLVDTNRGATKHFDSNIAKAAERLKIVFDTYGNIAVLPLNDQTSLTYNILQEFEDNYAEDVKTVGIAQWLSELKERNSTVNNLMKERFDETASKNDVVLKDARAELDSIYNAIVERINAFALVEEESKVYGDFIKTWNVIVDKYAAGLRRGKKGQNQDLQLSEPGLKESNN